MIRFRPHSVGALMTDPATMDLSLLTEDEQAIYSKKNRTEAEKVLVEEFWARGLSKGAKSALMADAKEMLYGYTKKVSSKEMDKGNQCEQDSINLYNKVHMTRHVKHEGRVKTDLLSGECDILVPKVATIDIKTSWSLDTFPAISDDCHDAMYEWQGRAYMHLYDTQQHTVAFCMVSTPDDLIPRWEQTDLHKVDHIHPAMRVTTITYRRDARLEQKMLAKCRAAQQYLTELVERIREEHQ